MAKMGNKIKKPWRGQSTSRFHQVWSGMKARCSNSRLGCYPRYGGRGIRVCKKWLKFSGFYEDMYSSYLEGLSIDRVNNNGNYCKENCRWATVKEQAINRSNTRLFRYKGKSLTLYDWSVFLGIKRSTLSMRFYHYKWPAHKVLSSKLFTKLN